MKSRLLLFLALVLWSLGARAETPDNVQILHTSMAGSGCDRSTAQALISPDFKDVSILFDNYRVDLEPVTNPRDRRDQKRCRIVIQVGVPQGWQFAFQSVDYRGFVALPLGVTGFHRFSILSNRTRYDSREVARSFQAAQVKGPINEDFYIHVEQPASELTWSVCGDPQQRVKLISEIMVMNPNRRVRPNETAEMVLDSADASLRQNFSVVWRRCSR